ncbi:MAG: hypothetical protein R2880_14060 [Deinococcales bacterium]
MNKLIRKLYNQFDSILDQNVINVPVNKRGKLPNNIKPLSAKEAFEVIWPQVSQFDAKALLYSLQSGKDLDQTGHSNRWSFSFDLPSRLAILMAEVYRESPTDPNSATMIDISVVPFAGKDSTLSTMAKEGDILYRQIRETWQERLRLRQYLPKQFIDSVDALSQITQGEGFKFDGLGILSAKVLGVEGAVWMLEAKMQQKTVAFGP